MTYFKNVNVSMADSFSIDAFGRTRTSDPFTLFTSNHEYDAGLDHWQSILTGSGSATHVPAQAAVRLRTTTASGDKVVRQTYRYFRYLPGKSQQILLTMVMGAAATNVRKRVGYFDASNGLFLEQSGGNLYVVRRSNVTGTPTDTAVVQSSWNLDKLDGTGASGYTIDMSKGNIFFIDLEWLGVGRVRMGFVIDGKIIYCHQFLNANNLDTVYMTTANLPIRYEIENTGVAVSSTNDFNQICASVASEGGGDAALGGRLRAFGNGATAISVSTRRAVCSIRPKATFNSIVNRGRIQPTDIEVMGTGNQPCYIEVVRNATLTGASFASVSASSIVEGDVAASTVSGGEVIWAGYISNAGNGQSTIRLPFDNVVNTDVNLTLDHAGANPMTLTVVATSFGNATNVLATINWKEVW